MSDILGEAIELPGGSGLACDGRNIALRMQSHNLDRLLGKGCDPIVNRTRRCTSGASQSHWAKPAGVYLRPNAKVKAKPRLVQ